MKKISSFWSFILCYLVSIVVSVGIVHAFTTNGSNTQFDFTITQGVNNDITSLSYEAFLATGDLTGTINSSSYHIVLGFLITAPFLNGESCQIDSECYSDLCCSNVCASSCPSPPGSGGSGNGPRGGGGGFIINWTNRTQEPSLPSPLENLLVTRVLLFVKDPVTNVKLDVSVLEGTPLPLTDAYQYFRIYSIDESSIAKMLISFRLPKEEGYYPDNVALYSFEGSWQKLPTQKVFEDELFYYFESIANAQGIFGISYPKTKQPIMEGTGLVVGEEKEGQEKKPDTNQKPNFIIALLSFAKNGYLLAVLVLSLLVLGIYGAYRYALISPQEEAMHLRHKVFRGVAQVEKNIEDMQTARAGQNYKELLGLYTDALHSTLSNKEKIELYWEMQGLHGKLTGKEQIHPSKAQEKYEELLQSLDTIQGQSLNANKDQSKEHYSALVHSYSTLLGSDLDPSKKEELYSKLTHLYESLQAPLSIPASVMQKQDEPTVSSFELPEDINHFDQAYHQLMQGIAQIHKNISEENIKKAHKKYVALLPDYVDLLQSDIPSNKKMELYWELDQLYNKLDSLEHSQKLSTQGSDIVKSVRSFKHTIDEKTKQIDKKIQKQQARIDRKEKARSEPHIPNTSSVIERGLLAIDEIEQEEIKNSAEQEVPEGRSAIDETYHSLMQAVARMHKDISRQHIKKAHHAYLSLLPNYIDVIHSDLSKNKKIELYWELDQLYEKMQGLERPKIEALNKNTIEKISRKEKKKSNEKRMQTDEATTKTIEKIRQIPPEKMGPKKLALAKHALMQSIAKTHKYLEEKKTAHAQKQYRDIVLSYTNLLPSDLSKEQKLELYWHLQQLYEKLSGKQ